MVSSSIPASEFVKVYPDVLGAGGTGLDLIGLVLTSDYRAPIGSASRFISQSDVSNTFGATSPEAVFAATYFAGFDGSSIKPAKLLFTQFPSAAVPPVIIGGVESSLSALTAINDTLTYSVNGTQFVSASANLSTATSYSQVASRVQTAINHYDAVVTASISTTTMAVTGVTSGTLAVGQTVTGAGVTAGTTITGLGSGTGGTGTYIVSVSQTVSSGTLSCGPLTVTYTDGAFVLTGGTPGAGQTLTVASVGALAPALAVTAATGALINPGSVAGSRTLLDSVASSTQDWISFTNLNTSINPVTAGLIDWTNSQNNRYLYVMPSSSISAILAGGDLGPIDYARSGNLSGIAPAYDPVNPQALAAMAMGSIASIDFTARNGRTNLAYRSQSGIIPGVSDKTIARNLEANGYNFYGSVATANQPFQFFYPGQVTGAFAYIDSFINQVWLTNQFQLDLLTLLTSVGNIPFSPSGYATVENALQDTINQALDFGAIRAGVTLSPSQQTVVNGAAGFDIATTITDRGWYLLVRPASPSVRAARGPLQLTFYYTDGQSVQTINLNSTEVQ